MAAAVFIRIDEFAVEIDVIGQGVPSRNQLRLRPQNSPWMVDGSIWGLPLSCQTR